MEQRIFAHRGLKTKAPENTLAAFRLAAEQGLTWLETDVDILGDGTPVIMHDTLLDRTTDRSGYFYDLTQADLPVDAGSWFAADYAGEPMPTLRDLVDFMNETGMNANIELKANEQGKQKSLELIDNVLAELERLDPEREVIFSSFSHVLLTYLAQKTTRPIGCLFVTENLWPDWKSVLELVGAQYIHPQDRGLTREMVQAFRAAGYGVNVWTVNDADRANELFNWGVTGVFSDVADELMR
ncbi:MAG: glycerophosphodiester phosphodiesterase family protein [Trueperella sp.]|nr:glycerophosphodiester phosphodiesterase family protein [Trueperella sp.]